MTEIRVRFAPSPTGPLHIGGVRTALYNFLFARKNNGKFILRIEDTDQARFVPGAVQYILDSLKWLGLETDENPEQGGPFGPYRQSERKDLYLGYAQQLVGQGHAYYAFDTTEELNNAREKKEKNGSVFKYDASTRADMRNSLTLSAEESKKLVENGQYVIRIKIPDNETIILNDLIRGNIQIHSSEIDDKVIFKSDGLPTYHLANVVDDHLMKISHVIRGEEWIPSTPLHVLLYRFLGWENQMPAFAHLPLILKPQGKGKLSKRDGDKGGFPVFPLNWQDPESGDTFPGYREQGYLPEAVNNILAFLGWNPGTEKEIYSLEELIHDFSLEQVGRSGARFNPDKAKWYNHQCIQQADNNILTEWFVPVLNSKGINAEPEKLGQIIPLVKDRIHLRDDIVEQSEYFFRAPENYDEKVVRKRWKENTPGYISKVAEILQACDDFTEAVLEEKVKSFIEKNELGFGAVLNPLRLCIVGSSRGIHLFTIMEMIGKEETLKRITHAISVLPA